MARTALPKDDANGGYRKYYTKPWVVLFPALVVKMAAAPQSACLYGSSSTGDSDAASCNDYRCFVRCCICRFEGHSMAAVLASALMTATTEAAPKRTAKSTANFIGYPIVLALALRRTVLRRERTSAAALCFGY